MALGVKTGGRRKGSQNKLTASAKEAFQHAFSKIGGAERLATWATENPTDFYKLYSKLIPTEIGMDPENPFSVAWPLPKSPLDQ